VTVTKIQYLSQPVPVSMANSWFDVSSLSHFWIKRRCEVLRTAMSRAPEPTGPVGEIGCGHGLLQLQLEELLGAPVDGFDLNKEALEKNKVKRGNLYCYDIHQRDVSLKHKYGGIFLFDVLEHIMDEDKFIESVLFHLSPAGIVYMNVPAFQFLFSTYDVADGHFRRYDATMLQAIASRNQLEIIHWTYWGLPLVPLLLMRKVLLAGKTDGNAVRTGFHCPHRFINALLAGLSKCERLPQTIIGTSLMAVLRRKPGAVSFNA
jgi:SAM-dependent methyltransferase